MLKDHKTLQNVRRLRNMKHARFHDLKKLENLLETTRSSYLTSVMRRTEISNHDLKDGHFKKQPKRLTDSKTAIEDVKDTLRKFDQKLAKLQEIPKLKNIAAKP